jgi:hypothetical protein
MRGARNKIVAKVMDNLLPDSFQYELYFKFLGHIGEYQPNRDSENTAGDGGKGYRLDIGACDHNFTGENIHGLAPTPRTNGGVHKCSKETKIVEVDPYLPNICKFLGAQMDAVQVIVD